MNPGVKTEFWVSVMLLAVADAVAISAEAGGSQGELEVIIVTAQKRAEPAQDIPVTVAVVSSESLAQNHVKDLVQAATLVPGVIFSRAPDDGLALTFRGLGTAARSQAFELSEALFVDGTFIGKGHLYTTSMFDLDRMEFIQGTESTPIARLVDEQPRTTHGFAANHSEKQEFTGPVAPNRSKSFDIAT